MVPVHSIGSTNEAFQTNDRDCISIKPRHNGCSFISPIIHKNLINDFSVSSLNAERITLLVVAIIVQALRHGFSIYLLNRIGQSVVAGIRDQLWKKLLVLLRELF